MLGVATGIADGVDVAHTRLQRLLTAKVGMSDRYLFVTRSTNTTVCHSLSPMV